MARAVRTVFCSKGCSVGSAVSDSAVSAAVGGAPLAGTDDGPLLPWQTDRTRAPVATKIVVAGGFGVGKTTLVTTVSEITPLQTEALMTEASAETDDLSATPGKLTTTVAMDFGRITLDDSLVLHLFGTPGQQRFWFMWDDLVRGAIGAVVLADTRRLKDCFPALDYFESCRLPYIVAVNHFDGSELFDAADVREALSVPPHIPVVIMDARDRVSVVGTLLSLVGHALDETPE
ncbi:ATP/GTP-binding protein [Streptomyces sp. SHP 1-2]|nr:ATP/GTP-binding protein [Streptomyces sp. SHP 1-2]